MRKIMVAAMAAAALIIAGPLAAVADEAEVGSAPININVDIDDYTPGEPTAPSLAGTTIIGDCVQNVPWISYSLQRHDPDGVTTDATAVLFMTDGMNSVEVPLGALVDNRLSGRVLWPGASVDANGVADGWPGWTNDAAGNWVQTDDNYAWTLGDIRAYVRSDVTELPVSLAYPLATAECLTLPLTDGEPAAQLPATGLDAAVLPIALVGGLVLLGGVGFVLLQRRRRT